MKIVEEGKVPIRRGIDWKTFPGNCLTGAVDLDSLPLVSSSVPQGTLLKLVVGRYSLTTTSSSCGRVKVKG